MGRDCRVRLCALSCNSPSLTKSVKHEILVVGIENE